MLNTVHLVSSIYYIGVTVPDKVELGLLDSTLLFFCWLFFVFSCLFLFLLVFSGQCVAVLEDPLSFSFGLIILKLANIVHSVGINPLALGY